VEQVIALIKMIILLQWLTICMNVTVPLKRTVTLIPSNRNSHIPDAKSPRELNFVLWNFGKFVLAFEF